MQWKNVSNSKSDGLEHFNYQTSNILIQLVNVGHLVPNQAKGYLVHPHRASVRSVHSSWTSWHRAWFNDCILGFETLAHHPGRRFHDFWTPARPGMMFLAQDRATNVFFFKQKNSHLISEYSAVHLFHISTRQHFAARLHSRKLPSFGVLNPRLSREPSQWPFSGTSRRVQVV